MHLYIRGVTVHKIHGTVRYIFDTGGGAIGYVTMLEIFLFYTMKASQWISNKNAFAPGFAHVQTLCKIYAGERLNLSQFTISRK